jgi:ParB family chromosome partitioning protein
VQRLVVDRRLSAGHGRALLGLAGHPLLERVAQRVAAEGMSVRKTEEVVRGYRLNEPRDAPSTARGRPATLDDMGDALSQVLHTRVRVTMGKRKGHVVIECGSRDDLQRICQGLLSRAGGSEGAETAEDLPEVPSPPARPPAGPFGGDLYSEI